MEDPTFSLLSQTEGIEELIAKTRRFMQAAKAPATRDAYATDFRDFVNWCNAHQLPSLPSNPPTVALYIADAADRLAPATIGRRLVSINQAHRAAGHFDSPASTRNPLIGATLKGIRRTLGVAQKVKTPLVADGVRSLVTASPANLLGLRDRALILIGYAGGFRRSSLAMIEVSDIADRADGIGITLQKSKTDQEGVGRVVPIPFGTQAATCPVSALRAWLAAAGITHGPVFRGVDRHGRVSAHGLNPDSIARLLRRSAARAGLMTANLAGHSLRSGLVTQCAINRVSPFATMEVTGHKSLAVLRLYARLGCLSQGLTAADLGL
jgi:site-specific recombinase XerD